MPFGSRFSALSTRFGSNFDSLFNAAAPPASLILDTLSAAAAYSLRLLRTAYTGFCVRVRRSSDNTEQNIGFVGGVIDTVALLAFVGAGDGFIATWYDQSGNARNAIQATAANQPRIVNTGALHLLNTKVSANFNGSNWLDFTIINGVGSLSCVAKKDVVNSLVHYAVGGVAQGLGVGGTEIPDIFAFNVPVTIFSGVTTSSPFVATLVTLSGNTSLFTDGLVRATSSSFSALNLSRIGARSDTGAYSLFGKSSETILFASALSTADRQLLEANQKAYYGTP